MKKAPAFWFTPRTTLASWMLTPLSWLWSFGHNRRMKRGPWAKLSVPVICVGNINVGGTGKTPTVIDILGRLQAMGRAPHVISRGYGGAAKGPLQVSLKEHTADDVGDEPMLLAAFAPTWVSQDRAAGAQAAIDTGADIIVLDDGLQNPALHKTLSIVVADATVGFGNGRILPAGPLREAVAEGLGRADLLLSIGPDGSHDLLAQSWPQIAQVPHVRATLKPLATGMRWDGLRVLAFAGIGRPQKFFDTLESLGAEVVQTRAFGDHQKLPLTMLKRLKAEADGLGAQLVTTEKDAARLPLSYQQSVLTLPVRLYVENPDALDRALAAL